MADMFLILEDDVQLEDGFLSRWDSLRVVLEQDPSWRALWLGLFDYTYDIYGDISVWPGIRQFSGRSRTFGAGAFAYVLRKAGALDLLSVVRAKGIQQAVDWFLFEQFPAMVCYYLDPPLAWTPSEASRDSDNDEEYPQARLLLDGRHAGAVEVTLHHPHEGAILPASDIQIAAELNTHEPDPLFRERHKASRLCYELNSSQENVQECFSVWTSPHTLRKPRDQGVFILTGRLVDLSGEVVAKSTNRTFYVMSSFAHDVPLARMPATSLSLSRSCLIDSDLPPGIWVNV
jgi:hypothetical protein